MRCDCPASGWGLLDKDAHPSASLRGLHRVYRLDVAQIQEPGQYRGDIEFAALRQMRHICDRAPAIDKQEDPTFPAWELAGKRRCLQAGDNAEHGRCVESSLLLCCRLCTDAVERCLFLLRGVLR